MFFVCPFSLPCPPCGHPCCGRVCSRTYHIQSLHYTVYVCIIFIIDDGFFNHDAYIFYCYYKSHTPGPSLYRCTFHSGLQVFNSAIVANFIIKVTVTGGFPNAIMYVCPLQVSSCLYYRIATTSRDYNMLSFTIPMLNFL